MAGTYILTRSINIVRSSERDNMLSAIDYQSILFISPNARIVKLPIPR